MNTEPQTPSPKPIPERPSRKYAKNEVVFIRCRVVNYDFDTRSFVAGINNAGGKDTSEACPDLGEYLLETINRSGSAEDGSRVFWLNDLHLVSLAEAKRAAKK